MSHTTFVTHACDYSEGIDSPTCGKPAPYEYFENTYYEFRPVDETEQEHLSSFREREHFWLCQEHHDRAQQPEEFWARQATANLRGYVVRMVKEEFHAEEV